MHKLGIFLTLLCFSLTSYAIPINPEQLIKVTDENNPKCVEYYSYKGEMYCSTKPLSPEPINPSLKNYERQKIIFDDRVWMPAWGKSTDKITTIEYVPAGDDINDWKELVTSQYFPSAPFMTPEEYAEKIIAGINEDGFSPIIKFFDESPDKVIFEFRILTPENQQQDELQLIRKVNHSFYVLHYVIKKPDMEDKQRDLWLNNLRHAEIKP